MFRGVTTLNLDAKGRIAVPAKYRDQLHDYCEGQLVVTVDRSPCLLMYPLPDWQEIEEKIIRLPSLHKKARELQRFFLGYASDCEPDGHGRLLLPPELRKFAALEKRVVLVGQGKKFEIWNAESWNERCGEWLADDEDDGAPLPPEMENLSF